MPAPARGLRIDETTVGRRLARIERALGLRLFEAVDGVRKPTRQCETVLAHVQAMAGARRRDRQGRRQPGRALTGRFRIASTNAVAEELLSPRAGALAGAESGPCPAIPHLQRERTNSRAGRPISPFACASRTRAISRSRSSRKSGCIFSSRPTTPDVEPVVCGYPEDLGSIPESQFLKARGLQQRARCVTDNIRVIRTLIQIASGRRHPARIFLRANCSPTAACAPRRCRGAATSGCWCRTTSSAIPPRAP